MVFVSGASVFIIPSALTLTCHTILRTKNIQIQNIHLRLSHDMYLAFSLFSLFLLFLHHTSHIFHCLSSAHTFIHLDLAVPSIFPALVPCFLLSCSCAFPKGSICRMWLACVPAAIHLGKTNEHQLKGTTTGRGFCTETALKGLKMCCVISLNL